jgi:hypothetical protein
VSRYRLYLECKYGDDLGVQDFIAEQLHEFGNDGGSDTEANDLAEREAAEEQGEGEGDEQHEAEWAEEAGQGSDSRDEAQGRSSGERVSALAAGSGSRGAAGAQWGGPAVSLWHCLPTPHSCFVLLFRFSCVVHDLVPSTACLPTD